MTDKPQEQHSPLDINALGDEVPESLHPLLQSIVDNIAFIIGAIALLILAVGGTAIYNSIQATKIEDAKAALAVVSAKADATVRATELSAMRADIPSVMETALLMDLANALSESGKHAESAAIWGEIAASDTTVMRFAAGMGQAAELAHADDGPAALAVLEALRKDAPEAYKAIILYRIAQTSVAAGDYVKALEAYESLKAIGSPQGEAFLDHKIKEARAKNKAANS